MPKKTTKKAAKKATKKTTKKKAKKKRRGGRRFAPKQRDYTVRQCATAKEVQDVLVELQENAPDGRTHLEVLHTPKTGGPWVLFETSVY